MFRSILLWILSWAILPAVLCWPQMLNHYNHLETANVSQNFSNLSSNNLWHKQANSSLVLNGITSQAGYTAGTDSSGNVYLLTDYTSTSPSSWAYHSEYGQVSQLAYANGTLISRRGGCFYSWNGSAWVSLLGGCGPWLSGSEDNSLLVVGTDSRLYASINGSGWAWPGSGSSTGWIYTAVANSTVGFAINSDCSIWRIPLPSGTPTQIPGASCLPPSTDAGEMLFVIGTDGYGYYLGAQSQTLHRIQGSGLTAIANGGPFETWALGPNAGTNIYRLPDMAMNYSSTVYGSSGCPQGSQCPYHTPHIRLNVNSPAYYYNQSQGPGVLANAQMNYKNSSPVIIDPFICFDAAQTGQNPCNLSTLDQIICPITTGAFFTSTGGSSLFNNLNCIIWNRIPKFNHGWGSGGTIQVYINSYDFYPGSLMANGICVGLQNWTPVNFNTYYCSPASGPPPQDYPGEYIYVSRGPGTASVTYPCGYYDTSCSVSKSPWIQHSWIVIGQEVQDYNTAVKVSAHEEGHDNFLGDCPHCKTWGGNLMGPQPTASYDQPSFPQVCDIFWYRLFYSLSAI